MAIEAALAQSAAVRHSGRVLPSPSMIRAVRRAHMPERGVGMPLSVRSHAGLQVRGTAAAATASRASGVCVAAASSSSQQTADEERTTTPRPQRRDAPFPALCCLLSCGATTRDEQNRARRQRRSFFSFVWDLGHASPQLSSGTRGRPPRS